MGERGREREIYCVCDRGAKRGINLVVSPVVSHFSLTPFLEGEKWTRLEIKVGNELPTH